MIDEKEKEEEEEEDQRWLGLSLGLGGGADGGGGHCRRGDSIVVCSDMQIEGPSSPCSSSGRHQAHRVAGEQRQVLWVKEERRRHQVRGAASIGVGKKQVPTAIQRGDRQSPT